ncbi:hypothetical protein M2271_006959 [Streptomyces sp. LBL]|uniref:hypothetical protein n=1 Tax=Streptomyces sp. LBL TaxID=2940562 RepID=UPI0024771F09|nr:hypothetical protein [Streptomyces sp. LBL]MDH6629123.1 hypothetical protein [Streptomyces sp. LBL]
MSRSPYSNCSPTRPTGSHSPIGAALGRDGSRATPRRRVGAHLYRIYPRLGITSRGKLAAALSALHDVRPSADSPGAGTG